MYYNRKRKPTRNRTFIGTTTEDVLKENEVEKGSYSMGSIFFAFLNAQNCNPVNVVRIGRIKKDTFKYLHFHANRK
jgi:hypothetical protein